MSRYLASACNQNLSVHIGEYGASNGSTALATEAMFNVPNNVSEGSDGFDLTTGPASGGGYEINAQDSSKPTNLTWFGQSCLG
ncbi:hypothetical protein FHS19_003506 [Paenibacillus rhizosphaerae]|uniref:Uncharacterized protein n=1 Tax=Paenibacillus rhizosphaerae TaxID=297318 RepID=A0A839TQJ3_9BACL|nr:hypothetical protein [Paenibacillus rhizosphaerae]MBB3128831.1 hypothetical protein [Paenibacillus rhizosphaerae]